MDFFHLQGLLFLAQFVKDSVFPLSLHAMSKISNFYIKEVKLTANTFRD